MYHGFEQDNYGLDQHQDFNTSLTTIYPAMVVVLPIQMDETVIKSTPSSNLQIPWT
jgi:hypothetical protein